MEEKNPSTNTNVAVFIDYENVHKTLLEQRTNILRLSFFEKLRKWCSSHQRRIVKIVVYCNFDNADLHNSYHQSTLQSYGVETVHTSNQGKNYADLKLTIDVLISMYSNNNIDEFFIMSNDKDMTPLLNTIRANKRNVSVITTGKNYNPTICAFADEHLKLEDICAEEVEDTIIDTIANDYWKKASKYMEQNIKKHEDNPNEKFLHYDFKYALTNEICYSKIMDYELATIIKDLYDKKEIFFYDYTFNNAPHIGLALSARQKYMIEHNIIKQDDIIESYDIDTEIAQLYDKALNSTGKKN